MRVKNVKPIGIIEFSEIQNIVYEPNHDTETNSESSCCWFGERIFPLQYLLLHVVQVDYYRNFQAICDLELHIEKNIVRIFARY